VDFCDAFQAHHILDGIMEMKLEEFLKLQQGGKSGIVDVSPSIAYHGGTQGSLFGLRCKQNSMVNARDSQFILVWALDHDRVIALRLVSVSLCVGLIVKCCVTLVCLGTPPSFI